MNIFYKLRVRIGACLQAVKVALQGPFEMKRRLLEDRILHCCEKGVTDIRYTNHEIIVSLTTYGKRIYDVALTIESIMEQTMKANRIVLWLGDDLKSQPLPISLQLLQKRGLEIYYCKDIRSYTKLIPALHRFPDSAIITLDDDCLYNYDLLEHLIVAYRQNSDYIYCHRAHKMLIGSDGILKKYNKWEWGTYFPLPDILCFPTGVGGVLYPPHSLDEEVFNEDVFMSICRFADDVWFKAMAMKKGTLSVSVFSHNSTGSDYVLNDMVQDMALCLDNVYGGLNDKQIQAVFTKYNLFEKLH